MAPDVSTSVLPIGPPAQAIYVAGDESLRFSVLNAAAGVTVRLAGRFMHRDGRVEPFVDRIVPATDRSVSVKTIPLADGWLLHAQASVSAGTPQIGQTFAVVSLVRGRTGAFDELATLAAGPVSAVQRLAWPGSLVGSPLEGAGALRFITGTNPGAGLAINETVPTGARWQLLYFKVTLTTSAVVANRLPSLSFDDGTNYYLDVPAHTTTAASSTKDYMWAHGMDAKAAGSAAGLVQGMGTTAVLPAGHRIHVSASALDAGDAFTAIRYLVREWIEGA